MTTTTTPVEAPDLPATQPYRWRWLGLFVILAAEVMDLLDALVTTIAGPSIRTDLGGADSLIQWLGAAYTLAMAVGLVTGGRLGDLFGRRLMFMIGAGGFVTSSAVCALAQSPGMLIGARVAQGLFGALMLPQGLGIIREMFSAKELAGAFGAFGPVMGLSAVGGPILAGWLVTADYFGLGWRMIFLINLPLGILAVAGAAAVLPASRRTGATRLDLGGVAILSAGAFMVIYPLVQGRELGWPLWTYLLIAAGILTFGLFTQYTRGVQRRGGDPLVTPSLFRKRAFTGGLLAGGAFFSGMIGFSLVFSLYLQLGLNDSPLKTGLAAVPQAAGMVIGFVAASAGLTARLGRRLLHIGLVVMAAGVALFAVIVHAAGTAGVSPWHVAPALAVTGIGTGLLMAPFFDLILAGVEEHEMGSASGSLNAVQQLGGALGIAILGTVFFNILKVGRTGPVPATVEHGMQVTLWIEIGLLAVTFAAAFLLPKRPREEEAA
ncbi:MFS transporter [Rugosimonospora africana]|uniref:Putative actinorhodin transporter n=1 Tax=Rugosimonospora africana TaxID=556532 RepID=A0A8J3VSI8_9ACTN|nr:MFS transporter [Rugosimonospora africana]GIH16513.1 putative actinorhodin transporter [Rugosimonospora africana]